SCFYPPGGSWLWAASAGPAFPPEWSGPHCFTVHYLPYTLVVFPETLYFEVPQGWPNPPAQSFFVHEVGGADIDYYITDSVDAPFFVDKYGGTTPDSVVVTVDAAGLPVGTYMQPVTFDATEANNTPLTVHLKLTVTEPQIASDSLVIPSVVVDQVCGAVQPVAVQISQPIKGATIPIEIPSGVTVLDLSFEGLITESWDYKFTEINPNEGFAFVALANSQGLTIPVGTTTVFYMTFNAGTAECQEGSYMRWDTTLMDDPGRALLFADTNNYDLLPGFDYLRDSTLIPGYVPGDFDGNQSCNVSDVTGLVAYLFLYGPPPCVLNAMDVNGSCTGPNIADVTYIVDYLFRDGAEPLCGCLGKSVPLPKVNPDILVTSFFENDVTTIQLSSPIDLRGVQLELKGAEGATVANLFGEKLDLVYCQRNGIVRVGLLDLDGAEIIATGDHQLVSIPGKYELVSAIVSDMDHHDIVASIGSKLSELPDSYALDQNFPNPFNPMTAISFTIPAASYVKLEIYNIMGQKVTTLIDRQMEAGRYTIQWDASNVASGVYLYRLQAGDFVDTKKMTLLK
ncbi:MAG: T9SS type A sorting domain-containing protein, partial [Candidatus Zixiibacteriota bacterium]